MNSEKKQHNIVVNKSRRSFTRTGIAAPVILSLASRPSWALDNCSFVQAMSGNISQHPDAMCSPGAPSSRSPGFYQGQPVSRWLDVYGVDDDNFNNVFGSPADVQNRSLKEVITANPGDLDFSPSIGSAKKAKTIHYIAAYLNAISPVLVFPYTAVDIVNDWGVWALFSNLQLIQDRDMTVQEVNDILMIV